MLREDSVNYTSLPQDEGTTPNSAFITTRSAPVHNQRDCKIATILTIGIIVAGIGLAATIPFIVKGMHKKVVETVQQQQQPSEGQGQDDFWSSHLNAGDGDTAVVVGDNLHQNGSSDPGLRPNDSMTATPWPKEQQPVTPGPAAAAAGETVEQPRIPHPVLVTFEPQVVVTTVRSFSSSGDNDGETNAGLGSAVNESSALPGEGGDEKDKGEGDGSNSDSGKGGKEGEDAPVNEAGTGDGEEQKPIENGGGSDDDKGSVTSKPGDSAEVPDAHLSSQEGKDDVNLNELLNAIYGAEGNARPTSLNEDSWMGAVGSAKYKATLITLASVVAVAVAGVIAAIGWLIHARIASRRRRINIQNVITDLQSRDKVVLLNSESEEE
ncbi:uncharacterized protein LOC135204306 [Macrobrachium nipponense]|uniref:uncharacterized protein LOC135204306 n=1 Tax=Macrobrachium nipponense TaxID=159736 RepID=UPI0030C88B6B